MFFSEKPQGCCDLHLSGTQLIDSNFMFTYNSYSLQIYVILLMLLKGTHCVQNTTDWCSALIGNQSMQLDRWAMTIHL